MGFILSLNNTTQGVLSSTRQATRTLDETALKYPDGKNKAFASVDGVGSIATTLSSYSQYMSGAKDATLILDNASQGLDDIQNILNEMRIIAVLGKSTSLSSEIRDEWGGTFNDYKDEILNIVSETEFQKNNLLDGSFTKQKYVIGPQGSDVLNISISSHTPDDLEIGDLNIDSFNNSSEAITAIDEALRVVNANQVSLGAQQAKLDTTLRENNVKLIHIDETNMKYNEVTTLETFNTNVDLQSDRYKYIKLSNLKDNTTIFNIVSDNDNLGRSIPMQPQELVVFLYERNDLDDLQESGKANSFSFKL